MQCPCQDCPYRKLRCHDRCDEYMTYHDALVDAKKKIREANDAIDYLMNMATKRRKEANIRK